MDKRSRFTREEKIAAVKLISGGRSATSVANEYGVHPNTVWKWQEVYRTNPGAAFTGAPVNAEEAEIGRLKRRNAELEAEVDFLKKATAYFAKNPR